MAKLSGIPLDDWFVQGLEFNYRGYSTRYWTAGTGEPLLLIHGFPSGSWDWHYLWHSLSERYRVIAVDMMGFGFSAKPRAYAYSLLDQADLLQEVLLHLGVEQYHILAHDYGDSVAQELLARELSAQRRMRSVCFLNGGLFPETHHPVRMQKLLMSPIGFLLGRFYKRENLEQAFNKIFGPQTKPSELELDGFWRLLEHNNGPRVMHLLIHYIAERRAQRDRWLAAMQAYEVPMRVIDGAVDPVSGAHMVERYRELIEQPDTVLLGSIGHYPQVEAPELVLKHYLAFRAACATSAPAEAVAAPV